MTANILIGTPCHGGVVHVNYFQSMLRLLPALERRGIGAELKTLSQESLISRARNVLAAEFMGRSRCTHLLFIDADVGFQPETVMRLLDLDKPVACAAYPMKGYDWEQVFQARAQAADAAALKVAGLRFAINVHDEDRVDDGKGIQVVNGFAKVSKAGTGMMLVRRDVFARLREAFPQLQYRNDIAGYDNDSTRGNFWCFFDTLVHPKSQRALSEDYAFCHRWTQGCGGEVWLDLRSRLSHHGHAAYEGGFLERAAIGGLKAP